MSHSNYMKVSGVIFLALAIVGAWSAIQGEEIVVGTTLPMWGNWAVAVVGAYLAYHALGKKH